MSRIKETFDRLRRNEEKALIAYLTVGFPSLEALPDLVNALLEGGVDLIELGIPFSDPLADGPTIQTASRWALDRGVTAARVLHAVQRLRRSGVKVPIVLMTYYNPIFHFGLNDFCRHSAASKVDGLIVPDLPPEEAGDLVRVTRSMNLDLIFLAAPTSPSSRLKRIVRLSSGFIYYVSLTGVTGAHRDLSSEVIPHVRSIQRMTHLPVCVGFGISGPEQVRRIVSTADGVIVGSALLDLIRRSGKGAVSKVKHFARQLKEACLPPACRTGRDRQACHA